MAPKGDTEIVEWSTIVEQFALEDVNHSPAFFDIKKLLAFNGEYIRMMSPDGFVRAAESVLTGPGVPWPSANYNPAIWRAIAPLVQTRVSVMSEVPAMVDFLFLDQPVRDDAAFAKAFAAEWAVDAMTEVVGAFADCEWNADAIKAVVELAGESRGVKLGKMQAPVRVAVTGRSVGPPLFESIELLGRDETVRRIRLAVAAA